MGGGNGFQGMRIGDGRFRVNSRLGINADKPDYALHIPWKNGNHPDYTQDIQEGVGIGSPLGIGRSPQGSQQGRNGRADILSQDESAGGQIINNPGRG
ncbi:MAG: hypothetical protein BWY71_01282 [Planctomycetes bacterium ADurb.Bin412]|nr:MAG: hypothetical protein BWY71_01282 [Planctomycetes bacterium ADurb.Bin412]